MQPSRLLILATLPRVPGAPTADRSSPTRPDANMSTFTDDLISLPSMVSNSNFGARATAPLPPTNRTLAEQMNVEVTDDGILPECFKACMRKHDGKAHTYIHELTVAGWCHPSEEFDHAQSWLNYFVLPCAKHECRDNLAAKVKRARAWMRDTCGTTV